MTNPETITQDELAALLVRHEGQVIHNAAGFANLIFNQARAAQAKIAEDVRDD